MTSRMLPPVWSGQPMSESKAPPGGAGPTMGATGVLSSTIPL